MSMSQGTIQTMPAMPITANGSRQLPGSGPSISHATSGVSTAPMDAPLCSTLLPSARSLPAKSRCVVMSAQGQCPDSK